MADAGPMDLPLRSHRLATPRAGGSTGAWIRSPVADSPDQVGAEDRGSYGDGGDGVADANWQEPERACGIKSAMTAANPAPTAMRVASSPGVSAAVLMIAVTAPFPLTLSYGV